MIFCQKVGKRGVKHETFLMWNGIKSFRGKPFHFCHVNFFLKNREAAYFSTPPPQFKYSKAISNKDTFACPTHQLENGKIKI